MVIVFVFMSKINSMSFPSSIPSVGHAARGIEMVGVLVCHTIFLFSIIVRMLKA